jgi:hypothetical protein
MQPELQPDYPKIIITLAGLLLGSWGVFFGLVKYWVKRVDTRLEKLEGCANQHDIDKVTLNGRIDTIKNLCDERHNK